MHPCFYTIAVADTRSIIIPVHISKYLYLSCEFLRDTCIPPIDFICVMNPVFILTATIPSPLYCLCFRINWRRERMLFEREDTMLDDLIFKHNLFNTYLFANNTRYKMKPIFIFIMVNQVVRARASLLKYFYLERLVIVN